MKNGLNEPKTQIFASEPLCFQGIQNSLPSFWAKLGYSRIKIDRIEDSLLKLQIKIGVHLINAKLLQLLTLFQPKSTSCKFTRFQQQSSLEKRANNSRAKNSRPPTGMVFDNSCGALKVRQFQNEFMKSSFLPKYEQKIAKISALTTQGRNPDNFLFVLWEKQWLHKFIQYSYLAFSMDISNFWSFRLNPVERYFL